MTVPVLLFTGFLGAGKTTLINGLLSAEHGKRIAALVNDFGAINIDAELIESRDEEVIGLANGCICCSLQGDFLRSVKTLLTRAEAPDLIVVEASGVAEPGGIVQMIQDPALWRAITLECVICAVDAEDLTAAPERVMDPLWKAQLAAADYVFLTKGGGLDGDTVEALAISLRTITGRRVFDTDREGMPLDLMLTPEPDRKPRAAPPAAHPHDERFAHLEWRSDGPVDQAGFKTFLSETSPRLLRAKGVVTFADMPERSFLLQLVGLRATLTPHPKPEPGCRLVFIGERKKLAPEAVTAALEGLRA